MDYTSLRICTWQILNIYFFNMSNLQGLRQDLKVWVCKVKKTGCVSPKSCVQSIGQRGQKLGVYLQIWVCKTHLTLLAG